LGQEVLAAEAELFEVQAVKILQFLGLHRSAAVVALVEMVVVQDYLVVAVVAAAERLQHHKTRLVLEL
jgi:hypothetical protein